MIQDQLAASTAGRYHRHLTVALIRFRVSHSDNSLDRAVTFKQRTAECDRLGADRHAADRGAEVNASPDAAVAAANRCRHRVPERPVMPCQHIIRSHNERVICRVERQREGCPPTQRPRPPRPCPRWPAWRWRPRRIARELCAQWPRRPLCDRAGIAWRSPGPGRSAGCHG